MVKEKKDRLLFRISRIPETGETFEEEFSADWLDNIPEFSGESATRIKGKIRVWGRLLLEGDNLRVKGSIATELSTFCTSCAEDMVYPLSGAVDIVLLKGPPPELPAEIEITVQDAAAEYYEGDEVDLAPFFKEAVALQVPIQTLCREDCHGLCPKCGKNLNYDSCACEKEEGDPRLEILRKLKIE